MQDVLERLADKSIPVRAEAAETLGLRGGVDAVLALLEVVKGDKSRSVKLCAAAGAADILARHRGAAGQPRPTDAQHDAILEALARLNPVDVPAVLLCYAAFPETAVIQRLTRMLRDPRWEARTGAAAALRRMALSAAAYDEGTGLREWIGDALDNRKLPIDSVAEMVTLVGQAGWLPLRPRVERVQRGEGLVAEAASTAIARLDARLDPVTWQGVWIDEGRDVGQVGDLSGARWVTVDDPVLANGEATIDGTPHRLIWAARLGEEGTHPALQSGGRTAWKLTPERAVAVVLDEDRGLTERPEAVPILLPMLDEQKGLPAARAAALLLVRTGHHAQVVERLEQPLSGKRPRNDLFFLRGLARHHLGDTAAARSDLERYLEKAKKSEPWREEASELLG